MEWFNKKMAIALNLTKSSDRTSIFTYLYDKGLTLASFLGIISSWKNVPAYRLNADPFKSIS